MYSRLTMIFDVLLCILEKGRCCHVLLRHDYTRLPWQLSSWRAVAMRPPVVRMFRQINQLVALTLLYLTA